MEESEFDSSPPMDFEQDINLSQPARESRSKQVPAHFHGFDLYGPKKKGKGTKQAQTIDSENEDVRDEDEEIVFLKAAKQRTKNGKSGSKSNLSKVSGKEIVPSGQVTEECVDQDDGSQEETQQAIGTKRHFPKKKSNSKKSQKRQRDGVSEEHEFSQQCEQLSQEDARSKTKQKKPRKSTPRKNFTQNEIKEMLKAMKAIKPLVGAEWDKVKIWMVKAGYVERPGKSYQDFFRKLCSKERTGAGNSAVEVLRNEALVIRDIIEQDTGLVELGQDSDNQEEAQASDSLGLEDERRENRAGIGGRTLSAAYDSHAVPKSPIEISPVERGRRRNNDAKSDTSLDSFVQSSNNYLNYKIDRERRNELNMNASQMHSMMLQLQSLTDAVNRSHDRESFFREIYMNREMMMHRNWEPDYRPRTDTNVMDVNLVMSDLQRQMQSIVTHVQQTSQAINEISRRVSNIEKTQEKLSQELSSQENLSKE